MVTAITAITIKKRLVRKGGSFSVVLPMQWVRRLGINPDKETICLDLVISADGNGHIVVRKD